MQQLSLRKYAATVGVSHTAVSKAIKAGHIVKGWNIADKKIIVEWANNEWGNFIKEKIDLKGSGTTNDALVSSLDLITNIKENEYRLRISENITFSEARRRKEIYIAEISRLNALKESGVYVEKQLVYRKLFDFGQSIRTALQAIPDRIIDKIMVAKTRMEAHNLLLNAIDEVLNMLTKPPAL